MIPPDPPDPDGAGGDAAPDLAETAEAVAPPDTPDREASARPDPRAVVWGRHAERIEAQLRELDPELGDLIVGTVYERVFADPALDLKSRELIAVALLAAQGDTTSLGTHLRGALRAGASYAELRAALRHTATFVGFPRALAAMRTLDELEREHGADAPGRTHEADR